MKDDLFDVAVIGAGPAGSAAAITLAAKGRRVLLLERDPFPRSTPCAGWLSTRAVDILNKWGVKTGRLLNEPFAEVTLYNADLSKSAKPLLADPVGYLVDRARFDQALVKIAVKNKAVLVQGCAVADLRLNESSVKIQLADGREFESRLLLLAPGRASPLLDRVRLAKGSDERPVWAAHVFEDRSPTSKRTRPTVGVVFGIDGGESFGFCTVSRSRVSVSVTWKGKPAQTGEMLVGLCQAAYRNQVVPVDLSEQAKAAPVVPTPSAAALDLDSHVCKHTLLIGDAGGFVSAVSNEGIYPAIWSARIAAEVIHEALDATPSQDVLMTFDSRWRVEMAEHIRSPHTDIRFLLPLIFTNQPMADRMGAAFFFGENI
ncbi:MAG: NAD(P)/FAD-dependent oxidoreductase [Planctomycetes bacterium]|nr:NAD(P)/FAD-dependent oxidoreductase [Planctomycetota bacterium]